MIGSGNILNMDPKRFANGLDAVCDRKREVKGDPRFSGLNGWKMELLCAEMGKVVRAVGLDGEGQESTLGTL